MHAPNKNLLLYIAKCMIGSSIVFSLAYIFHYQDISWFLISTMLVLSPNRKEAMPLALTRIKANLAGGAASLVILLLGLPGPVGISLALLATIILCHMFRIMDGSRIALAAVVIIMHGPEFDWSIVLDRMISVAGGCVLGLAITYAFHNNIWLLKRILPSRYRNFKKRFW